jgi:hypothetical protein
MAQRTGEPARKKAKRELLKAELSKLPPRQSARASAQATKARLQQQVILCLAFLESYLPSFYSTRVFNAALKISERSVGYGVLPSG